MVRMEAAGAALAVALLACMVGAGADGSDHRYKEGDRVPLYANKVGPFHNPSETYRYYDLPFCAPGLYFLEMTHAFSCYLLYLAIR